MTGFHRFRTCPVDAACGVLEGWGAFLDHIYHQHTEGSTEARQRALQRILAEGPGPQEHAIVPKVTANPLTYALWALANDDPAKARELTATMGVSERRAYQALLTKMINMLWSDA
jgi:hypothetical protein